MTVVKHSLYLTILTHSLMSWLLLLVLNTSTATLLASTTFNKCLKLTSSLICSSNSYKRTFMLQSRPFYSIYLKMVYKRMYISMSTHFLNLLIKYILVGFSNKIHIKNTLNLEIFKQLLIVSINN